MKNYYNKYINTLTRLINGLSIITKDLASALNWVSLSSLGAIIPRDKKLVVVMAPENGSFTDNAKYAYLWLESQKDFSLVYITYNIDIKNYLISEGIKAVYYPSLYAVICLIRCYVILSVATVPMRGTVGHLSCGAKLVQLWHGAGVKKVHLGSKKYFSKKNRIHNKIQWTFNRTHPNFDILYFPSEALREERKSWFKFKEAKINGFVRNDLLLGKSFGPKEFIFTDYEAVAKIKKVKATVKRMILYAPTYRKRGQPVFGSVVPFDFNVVEEILITYNCFLVLKMHPWMKESMELGKYKRILNYEKDKDIYPILLLFDILVTDYSSIFSDFAILNRPIVQYFPDYEMAIKSQKVSKKMIEKMPGTILLSFEDFIEHLEYLLQGSIAYKNNKNNTFHDITDRLSGPMIIEDIRNLIKT